MLFRAMLFAGILFGSSQRQLTERLTFVGFGVDDRVWDHSQQMLGHLMAEFFHWRPEDFSSVRPAGTQRQVKTRIVAERTG